MIIFIKNNKEYTHSWFNRGIYKTGFIFLYLPVEKIKEVYALKTINQFGEEILIFYCIFILSPISTGRKAILNMIEALSIKYFKRQFFDAISKKLKQPFFSHFAKLQSTYFFNSRKIDMSILITIKLWQILSLNIVTWFPVLWILYFLVNNSV